MKLRIPMIALILCLVGARAVSAVLTATLNPAADVTMYSENGALSNGGGQFFFAGKTSAPANRRSALKFDVSSIPAGSQIVSASLQITVGNAQGTNNVVTLYPVTEDWQEGTVDASGNEGAGAAATVGDTTWTSRNYNTVAWTNAGGTFNNTISATTQISGTGTYSWATSANMVSMVQSWVDTPTTNFGWLMIGDETAVGASSKQINSRTGTIPPVLTLTYLLPSYNPVLVFNASAPGTALVDDTIDYTLSISQDGMSGDGSDASAISIAGSVSGAAAYVSGDTNSDNILESGETWIYSGSYVVHSSDGNEILNSITVNFSDERGDPHSQNTSASTAINHVEVAQTSTATIAATEHDTVVLSVVATGGHGNFDYQWLFDNGSKTIQMLGTDNPTLTLASITTAQAGTYTCNVSDSAEITSSAPFNVTVMVQVPAVGTLGLGLIVSLMTISFALRRTKSPQQ